VNREHTTGTGHNGVASGTQYHMPGRMAQSGALRPDVTTTVTDYGDEQVNQEHTMGPGHKGVASGTIYHNGRQDGSSRCTTTICNNHSSRLWR
jgi:hypothetical protein